MRVDQLLRRELRELRLREQHHVSVVVDDHARRRLVSKAPVELEAELREELDGAIEALGGEVDVDLAGHVYPPFVGISEPDRRWGESSSVCEHFRQSHEGDELEQLVLRVA